MTDMKRLDSCWGGWLKTARWWCVVVMLGSACAPLGSQAQGVVGFMNVPVPSGFSALVNPVRAPVNTVSVLFASPPAGMVIYQLAPADSSNAPMSPDLQAKLVAGVLGGLPKALPSAVGLALVQGGLSLSWAGNLLTATNVAGPYTLATGLSSPQLIQPTATQQFWRAQGASALTAAQFTANVFSSGAWSDPNQDLPPGLGFIVYNPSSTGFTNVFAGQILTGTSTNSIPAGWSIRGSMVPRKGGLTAVNTLTPSPGDTVFLMSAGAVKQFSYSANATWTPSEPQTGIGEGFIIFAQRAFDWDETLNFSER